MNTVKVMAAAVVAAGCSLAMTSNPAQAQVSVSIGVAPECPYGYYDVPPYTCAPAGYYGPQWFTGGVFIGAGPWFHGPADFHGSVDNRFDPNHGYKGRRPARGERAEPARTGAAHFRGNEERDGRGHTR